MELYALLAELNIPFQQEEHIPVYTMADCDQLHLSLQGESVKNLFLTDRTRFFLYTLPEHERADLKALRASLGCGKLSFAGEEPLLEKLGLTPGAVTPLGLVNNRERDVAFILHRSLTGKTLLVHPNRNTATLSIGAADVLRLARHLGIPALCL